MPFGSAFVETMFVPWSPPAVGATLTPRSRLTTAARPLAVKKSGFETKFESGTRTSPTPWFLSTCFEGSLKLSSQTTSLASRRCAGVTSSAPACAAASFLSASAWRRDSAIPTMPL